MDATQTADCWHAWGFIAILDDSCFAFLIDFAFELNAEFTQFSTPTPLPGTEYYDLLQQKGCLVSERWEDFDSFHRANVNLPHLSTEELNRTLAGIYRRYYLRPRYVWAMVRRALRSRDDFLQSLHGVRALLRV